MSETIYYAGQPLEQVADTALVSDGYHTFGELYDHRTLLFLALMKAHPEFAWKAKCYQDGKRYEGWFIAGLRLPSGAITYHVRDNYWDRCYGIELMAGLEWDGHTSNDVLDRLSNWIMEAYEQ